MIGVDVLLLWLVVDEIGIAGEAALLLGLWHRVCLFIVMWCVGGWRSVVDAVIVVDDGILCVLWCRHLTCRSVSGACLVGDNGLLLIGVVHWFGAGIVGAYF